MGLFFVNLIEPGTLRQSGGHITIILAAIGLPLDAIGLLLVVDRILDMCRTSVNVFSDSCGAVIIGRLEGEEDILQDDVFTADDALEPTR